MLSIPRTAAAGQCFRSSGRRLPASASDPPGEGRRCRLEDRKHWPSAASRRIESTGQPPPTGGSKALAGRLPPPGG
eukprot:7188955-Alexandrium_andersonii.AAC.1